MASFGNTSNGTHHSLTNLHHGPFEGAVFNSLLTGLITGCLHAVTGVDHLATLLPLALNAGCRTAAAVGLRWGLGHGLGVALFGSLAFFFKAYVNVHLLSRYSDYVVGFTLVVIGGLGLRKATSAKALYIGLAKREEDWDIAMREMGGTDSGGGGGGGFDSLPSDDTLMDGFGAGSRQLRAVERPSVVTTVSTGMVHGFTGTGHLLGVLPAMSMGSYVAALVYLTGFCVGTFSAMAVFTAAVGEASVRFSEDYSASVPDMPRRISLISSSFAIAVGFVWCLMAALSTHEDVPPI